MSSSKISYPVILGLLCVVAVIGLVGLIVGAVALDRHKTLNTKTNNNNSDVEKLKSAVTQNTSGIATNKSDIGKLKDEVTQNTSGIATNKSDIGIQREEINKIKSDFAFNPIKLILNPSTVVGSNGRFIPVYDRPAGLLYKNSIFKIEIDDSNHLKITLEDSASVAAVVSMRIIYSKYNVTSGASYNFKGIGFQLLNSPPAIEYSDHIFNPIVINTSPIVSDSGLIRYDIKANSGIFYLLTDAGQGTSTSNFDGFMEFYFY